MDSFKLLTIAQAAEHLNCSTGFIRKRISLTEANQPGGWPKNVYVNLQPKGAKKLYRVRKEALDQYISGQLEQAKMEEVASPTSSEVCSTGTCTF
jgi:hypothetical protein